MRTIREVQKAIFPQRFSLHSQQTSPAIFSFRKENCLGRSKRILTRVPFWRSATAIFLSKNKFRHQMPQAFFWNEVWALEPTCLDHASASFKAISSRHDKCLA